MAATPTLEAMVNELIDQRLRQMQTAYPAEVIEYDATTSTATVMPLFIEAWRDTNNDRITETIENTEDTYVENVLVAFPRSGSYRMTYPIAPGDTGLVVCTKYSLDRFRENGGQADPGDLEAFAMSGSVFFPVNVTPDDDALDSSGGDGDAYIYLGIAGATDFIALAAKVKTELDEIKAALDKYDAHTHLPGTFAAGGDAVTGASGGPSAAHGYTATSVASTKTKVE